METISLQEFCKSHSVEALSDVRKNTNGYPYVTFLYKDIDPDTGKNKAENFYFSKSSAIKVDAGDKIKDYAKKLSVATNVANADGEVRTKLTFGDSEFTNLNSLFD